MTEPDQNATSATNREIVNTRLVNAPRALVFRAFSDPKHLAQWWGPRGFRNTVHTFDFRPGSHWHITLHGPDGVDYKNEYVLLEVIEPERIVISHPDPKHDFQLTVVLAEVGGAAEAGSQRSGVRRKYLEQTRLTWCMRFESAEHCLQIKPFVAKANEQNLDRLEAELAKMA